MSELAMRFEWRRDLNTEGEGGNHINQTRGETSILRGHFAINPSVKHKISKNVKPSEEILKINAQSRSNFKIKKVCSQSVNTKSGEADNWPGTSTNRRPGLQKRITNRGW